MVTGSLPSTSLPTAVCQGEGSGPRPGSHPDGICLDADGAVWYGDVPAKRCVRVREGGEVLQTIELDRGCFACALGGADGRTLFVMAAEFADAATMAGPRTGQVVTAEVPAPGVGWPYAGLGIVPDAGLDQGRGLPKGRMASSHWWLCTTLTCW